MSKPLIELQVSLALWAIFLSAYACFADTVYLKDGQAEEGKIVEDAPDYVILLDQKTLWKKVFYKKLIREIKSDRHINLDTYKSQSDAGKPANSFAACNFADTVYMENGLVENGEIIEDNKDYIVLINSPESWQKILYKKLIERIDSAKDMDLHSFGKPAIQAAVAYQEIKAGSGYKFGDTVYMKNGLVENGEIIEDSQFYIVLLNSDNTWKKIFYKTLIEKIDSDKNIDLQSYKKSAGEDRPDSRQEDEAAVSQEGEKGAAKEKPTTGLRRLLENLFPFLK